MLAARISNICVDLCLRRGGSQFLNVSENRDNVHLRTRMKWRIKIFSIDRHFPLPPYNLVKRGFIC